MTITTLNKTDQPST